MSTADVVSPKTDIKEYKRNYMREWSRKKYGYQPLKPSVVHPLGYKCPDYHKLYREQNKERLKTYSATVVQCECGYSYTIAHKNRHLKTQRHKSACGCESAGEKGV